jgi:hypothetical protein
MAASCRLYQGTPALAALWISVLSANEMDQRLRVRILYALFAAYSVATALHIAWVLAHEPFSFDAWNVAVDTHAKPFTVGNFFAYWHQQYTQSNPRLGQPLTYLGYKLEYVAEIALPLCLFTVTLAATTLGLGRWPWKKPRGMALWAVAIGISWFALPELGRNLFCRAYGLNYMFGAAVQLMFLVPLRLSPTRAPSLPRCIAYALLGFAAGMCNEHTGPAILALFAAIAFWLHRKGERPRLVWAGGIGFFLGFCAIFFAPGQGSRYDGLAQQMSLTDRVLSRGVEGNLIIFGDYLLWAAPLLGLIVIALIASSLSAKQPDDAGRRSALRWIAIAIAFGSIVAMTMFVSPKLGARFHFVGLALLLGGFLGLVDAVVVRTRWIAVLLALGLISSAYAAAKTIPLYSRVAQQGAERMAELEATPVGGIYVADAWAQIDESWWFIGDDFRDYRKRELVAKYFGLSRVFFRGYHPRAPLGLTGIRIVPRYWTEGASCASDYEEFEFGVAKGFDLAALHSGTRESIDILQRHLAPQQLTRFELPIVFAGERPALPRKELILSRWQGGAFEGYIAQLKRRGKSRTRRVVLPPELSGKPLDVFVMLVGGEFKPIGSAAARELTFEPWAKGVYWVLACDAATCWVVAASRM